MAKPTLASLDIRLTSLESKVNLAIKQVQDYLSSHQEPLPAPNPPSPIPTPQPEGINLSTVIVRGSDASALGFPQTAILDKVTLLSDGIDIRTTGTEGWPLVSIDGGVPSQAATLWIFLNIGGQWYATGAERLRPTQLNGTKPEGPPATLVGEGWLYDPNRWGPMAGYNPRSGESVGFMVVAGSTRSDNQTPLKARTNLLMIKWP